MSSMVAVVVVSIEKRGFDQAKAKAEAGITVTGLTFFSAKKPTNPTMKPGATSGLVFV